MAEPQPNAPEGFYTPEERLYQLQGTDTTAANNSDAKRASCKSSEGAIFRYSKWPTQAITYRLGKDQIYDMRKEAAAAMGDRFSPKTFHMLYIRQGSIPAGYFREELLRRIKEQK